MRISNINMEPLDFFKKGLASLDKKRDALRLLPISSFQFASLMSFILVG